MDKHSSSAPADRVQSQSGGSSRFTPSIVVGRTQEQACLRNELAAIASGGRLVLVGGEAGIGKTTLVRDLEQEARARGVRVLTGHCYDRANAPPYGPWIELFESFSMAPSLPRPPTALAGGRLTRVSNQAALFADVRRFFAQLAALGPVVILLEDLHWADPASIELLRYLGVYLGQWRILLVVTYRSTELAKHHPLYQHLPALVREADGRSLHLKGLDVDTLHELVGMRYRLSEADAFRLGAYLVRHADGNPFFAVELLRALEEDGLLRRGEDRSSLGELDRIVVPTLLQQVINGRIARLGADTRQPLEIAAVIGQEVSLALWGKVADLDEEALLSIVERAVGAHLIEPERDGVRVGFVHALTREALYDGVFSPRRRIWHRHVAEAMLASAHPDPDAVAYHLERAGDLRAWQWLERAADRAQRAYAWRTASERLRDAATLLQEIGGQERTYCQLLFRVACLLRFSDTDASIAALDEVKRLSSRIGDAAIAAEARYVRGFHLCYADRFREGLVEMEQGLGALNALPLVATRPSASIRLWYTQVIPAIAQVDPADDSVLISRLHAAGLDFRWCPYLWQLAAAGHLRQAVATSERIVSSLADTPGVRGGIRTANAFAYHALGIAQAGLGQAEEARRVWSLSRALLNEVDHSAMIAISLLEELREVTLTYGAACPANRRRLAAEAEAELERAGGALRPGVSPRLAWLGCLILDGRWQEANLILQDVPAPGNAYLRREVTTTLAVLAHHRGEPELAWDQIRFLLPDGPATEPGDIIHQEGLFHQRLAAELCLDADDLATARAWTEAHDRWIAWSGSVLGRADGQLTWARWHYSAGDPARARAVALDSLHLAAAPDQPLVSLAAHRLLGEIETAAGQYRQAEAHLTIAINLAEVCEAPFERALTLLALAETRLAKGTGASVGPLLDEVRELCVRLGATPTLARVEALMVRLATAREPAETYPDGLTRREGDVLRLLARQHTDKEIAEILLISRHTASTHVKHVLAKLGVVSRREAAAYAIHHGLT